MLSEYLSLTLLKTYSLFFDTAKLRTSHCVRKQFFDYYEKMLYIIDYYQTA